MATSLRDVATRAGVSVKTVSNVVNGYEHVSVATRERVQRVLDELNYRPNLSARNLRNRRSGIVALALPELDLPYFAELTRCVIKAAEARSWTVLIDQTDGLPERESIVLQGIRDQLIDGLIFSPLASSREQITDRLDDTPMVLLGELVAEGSADHVVIDNVLAARQATEHLIGLGRRRIAAIGDQARSDLGTAPLRLAGYRKALAAAGIPYDRRLVMPAASYHRAVGAEAMRRLLELDDPPDAVFCFTDLLALGALRTLLGRDIAVPKQIAIAGFDDIEDGRFSTPTLTTIAPDKDELARVAVELLASRIAGEPQAPPREVQAAHRLVIRESTVGRHG
jgi:DNA-binding LacI/PurR family transcriptional regulator